MARLASRLPRWIQAAFLLIAVLAVVSGCGTSAPQTTSTSDPTPANNATYVPEPTPTPSEQAKRIVRRYFAALTKGAFFTAWGMLNPSIRSQDEGFDTWRRGYRTELWTKVTDVEAVRANDHAVVLSLDLESADLDDCGDAVHQTFAGTWTLERESGPWKATEIDVEKTGGATPVTNGCPESSGAYASEYEPEYEYEEPPEEESSECDPNYTGACLDPNAYDYDCEGGSGDGPDYAGTVAVVGEDHFGLDRDGDGVGCEPY